MNIIPISLQIDEVEGTWQLKKSAFLILIFELLFGCHTANFGLLSRRQPQ